MRTATCYLSSASPYSQSKGVFDKKPRDVTHEDWEEKTWRQRLHVDSNGQVFIPPMAFKNVMSEAAQFKPTQIPGKGKTTHTKHIVAGLLCMDPVPLGIDSKKVEGEWLYVPSDGKRGGSKRVWKCFPIIPSWKATVQLIVVDDIIDEKIFEQTLVDAGKLIGIGRFRPKNNGYYGRFTVNRTEWSQS